MRGSHAQPRGAFWGYPRLAKLIPDNLKSRKDVPAAFQRIAEALEMGLDDDALVWYEPLYDPTARGGRGDKPDFVVLEPRRGIVVFEVVDIEKSALLGVLRGVMRVARDGREVEIANPVARATKFAAVLQERASGDAVLAGMRIPIGAAAIFPRFTRDEAREKGLDRLIPLERALFGPDLKAALSGDGSARLLRVLARVLGSEPLPGLPDDAEARLRMVVQPEIAIERVAGRRRSVAAEQLDLFRPPPEDRETHVRVMDQQQENIAKGLGSGHRVLRGVAGSGKTLMLVYRAKLLAEANPRHRVLLTCFTRSLASHLRGLLSDPRWRNVEVRHIDSVMQRAITDARLTSPGYGGDDGGEEVARMARQALETGAGPRYEAVLLDEGQDFGIEALRFVTGLLADGHSDLVLAMDGAQNIFRRRFSLKQAGIQAAGRTRVLRRNYRNTGEIGAFAYRFLSARGTAKAGDDEAAILEPELDEHAGEKPRVLRVESLDEGVAAVVEQVRAWRPLATGPRDIAVLYTRPDRERARRLHRALLEAEVPAFWVNDPDHGTNRDLIGQAAEPVVLSTVYSAKGFEYPRVVLLGLFDPRQGPEESRKLAYVGMTRATVELTVVVSRQDPLAGDL